MNLKAIKRLSILIQTMLLSLFLTCCGDFRQSSALSEGNSSLGGYLLPFTQVTLDMDIIHFFASLDLEQIIEELRSNFGVKVLVLPYRDSYPQVTNSKLIDFNLAEDLDAIEFYTAARQQETDEAAFFEAGLIIPSRPDSIRNRPYLNQDVIVLHLNADKNILIHEIMHLLISRSPERRSVYRNDSAKTKLADNIQKTKMKFFESVHSTERLAAEADQAKPNTKYLAAIDRTLRSGTSFVESLKQHSDNHYGEEMDISQLMYEMRGTIYSTGGISKKTYTYSLCKGYYALYFDRWLEETKKEHGIMKSIFNVYRDWNEKGLVSKKTSSYIENYNSSIMQLRSQQTKDSQRWLEELD